MCHIPARVPGKHYTRLPYRQLRVLECSNLGRFKLSRELTPRRGLCNQVDFPTNQLGESLNQVLTDLLVECVQCYQLDRMGKFDHHAVLSIINNASARDEEHCSVIKMWEHADWEATRPALGSTYWETVIYGDPEHDITFTYVRDSVQQQHVPHRILPTLI